MRRIKIFAAVVVFVSTLLLFSKEAFPVSALSEGLADLTEQIISSMAQKNKSRLAVMDFVNLDGSVNNFCRYLSEHLITKIYLTNKFEVIERRLLSKVLYEAKLSMSDIIDQKTAQKLGNILGVDSICTGSVSDLGRIAEVNARLFETNTGKIFAVASTQFQKDEMVASLMGQALKQPKKDPKHTNKSSKEDEGPEIEIPEGFDYLVVGRDGTQTPINGLTAGRKKEFYFLQSGGGTIRAKFQDFKLIKLFGIYKHDASKTVLELHSKSGKRYRGFMENITVYGQSELGKWSSWPHELKEIYIR